MLRHTDNYFSRLQRKEAPLPPITKTLGGVIRNVDLGAGTLSCDYTPQPEFLNPVGQVQGGMLSAMLDDVTALLVTATLAAGEHCATLNLNVSFLRPVGLGHIEGCARLIRRGKDTCNVGGELWQDGKLAVQCTAVCMVKRPG